MVGVRLEVPRKLNDEQRELVESLSEMLGDPKIHPEKQSFFDKVKDLFD